ncbi:MAG: hypothetical protein ABI823_19600, partial [Bryobacteraceae bacterium]
MKRTTRFIATAILILTLASTAGENLAAQSFTIRTVAGAPTLRDGSAANTAPLRRPFSIATDSSGNIYFSDSDDHRVRQISRTGVIATIAGTGREGYTGDGGPATAARLNGPQGITIDRNNNIYIADYRNNRIRKVTAATGIISTVAGNGKLTFSGDNQPAIDSALDPYDIAVDAAGAFLYLADSFNNRIRKINLTTGSISTIAGIGLPGDSGDNSPGTAAALFQPSGVSVDSKGNVYFCDNIRIRRIDGASGILTTYAGNGVPAFGFDGPSLTSPFPFPNATAFDAAGNLYVGSDYDVRVVSTGQNTTKIAGSNTLNYNGDGPATQTKLSGVSGVAVLTDGTVIIADSGNRRVRQIKGGAVTTIGGSGVNDGPSALAAYLNYPAQVAADGAGGYLIADNLDHSIRRVTFAGVISTIAGTGVSTTDNSSLSFPEGVAIGPNGEFYFADTNKNRIVRVNQSGSLVVAGGNCAGFSGDKGSAAAAKLSQPTSLSFDAAGNLYFADTGNFRVRKIDLQTALITTVAGNGSPIFSGDNQAATAAGCSCYSVTSDAAGNLFIADPVNNRVRRVAATTGIITTIAGNGSAGYSGDGGAATSAQLSFPTCVAVDSGANVFISDYFNSVIRRISSSGMITTVAGNGKLAFDFEAGAARQVAIDAK